jgi:hypothetical protein
VFWDIQGFKDPEQARSIYRLLKRKDIRPSLRDKEVGLRQFLTSHRFCPVLTSVLLFRRSLIAGPPVLAGGWRLVQVHRERCEWNSLRTGSIMLLA